MGSSIKRGLLLLVCALIAVAAGALSGCASTKSTSAALPEKIVFEDIWGYLMRGREAELTGTEPFTHLCYFSASVNNEGRIEDTVARPLVFLDDGSTPRIDLVITELSSPPLMHFSLSPVYGVRPLLIDDICRVSQGFDGVQIDFETVSADDGEYFWDFLRGLRGKLPPGKMLSVAVPARTTPKADAYAYSNIAPLVDRVVIMAYDEHWSTSSPGPVASLPWCSEVLDYAQSTIENDKIVMGLPLYGRAWQDKKLSRAMGFQNVQDIITEKNPRMNYVSELGSYFEYSEKVVVRVFYDDLRSLGEKLQLYKSKDIRSVAFWRIGLGPSDLWNSVGKEGASELPAADQVQYGFPPTASTDSSLPPSPAP